MKQRHALLALAVAASLLSLSACKKEPTPAPDAVVVPEGETADEFVARVNQEYKKLLPELSAAQWLSSTYINDDSELLSAKANERYLAQLNRWIDQSRKFEGQKLSPHAARAAADGARGLTSPAGGSRGWRPVSIARRDTPRCR